MYAVGFKLQRDWDSHVPIGALYHPHGDSGLAFVGSNLCLLEAQSPYILPQCDLVFVVEDIPANLHRYSDQELICYCVNNGRYVFP